MRDPDRIPLVLQEIEKVWRLHPDWRLGQLVCNLAAWVDPTQNIVWDVEDELVALAARSRAARSVLVERLIRIVADDRVVERRRRAEVVFRGLRHLVAE